MKRDERVYLLHILDAIDKVSAYVENVDEAAFRQNSLI